MGSQASSVDDRRRTRSAPTADTPPTHLAASRWIGAPCTYPRGTGLLRQGEPVRTLFFIDSGFVKLSHCENARDVVIGWRAAGWLLGVSSAVAARPSAATAQALTDCRIRPIHVDDFNRLRRSDAAIAVEIQEMLARELYDLSTILSWFCAQDVRQRLERLLVKWFRAGYVERSDGALQPALPLKRHELAQAIGVTPEHFSRLLGQIEEERVIRRHAGWVLIPSTSRLFRAISTRIRISRLDMNQDQA